MQLDGVAAETRSAWWFAKGKGHKMRTITKQDLAHGPVPVGDRESFRTANIGMPTYLYQYKGSKQLYLGVMAQDVLKVRSDCVERDHTGHMAVNYSKLFGTGFDCGRASARRDGLKAQNSLRATLGL
ncbi:hypothetical protein [Sinorhizobium fredii]|uniref:hypothetical protein n=1 Tax=Rhizobium fredii TaxID=380 RepID=UPI0033978441